MLSRSGDSVGQAVPGQVAWSNEAEYDQLHRAVEGVLDAEYVENADE